ncbi:macrolide ABC transporter ATP-binding protein [Enterovibrio norvegicus FF-33]|uniref:Macrolide ABC transporter ATP-binding protein n=1 Tax=Enterovibrio norvegicus FF-454 TaxID=1185651 RepID=A0A1E5CAT4_9GAMM|nr:ABC transporter ATP-binding protein [Enterovibrio norvegicus]OEE62600.1 macrolide ABC transporter ATP-binding protein [Enterovibrio norvegicus FF-454]OEE66690.1 macrolide ABC transporter ATP-binding protein [Enterovibrio norvegicus FF-33]
MINIESLHKSYFRGDTPLPIIRGVDLKIERGEFVTIMGASGSGKSTLLNIIGCLDNADTGTYHLDGTAVHAADSDGLATLRSSLIGTIFQSFNLLSRRDALANVMLPLVYQGTPPSQRQALAFAALERVGLADRATHLPNQLSGGQQQRVAIARALVNKPKLLIADEPTGALDSHTGQQVMDLFKALHAEGHTIVMVTHDAHLAKTADRVVHMRDGRIVI